MKGKKSRQIQPSHAKVSALYIKLCDIMVNCLISFNSTETFDENLNSHMVLVSMAEWKKTLMLTYLCLISHGRMER